MFSRDHVSAYKGPNPGNWEAAWLVEICRIAQDVLLFTCELM